MLTVLLLTSFIVIHFFKIPNANGAVKGKGNKFSLLSNKDRLDKELLKLGEITAGLKGYNLNHHFNSRYCFLVDMGIASGYNRFYIYDLQSKSIVHTGLVANGSSNYNRGDSVVFSNEIGSNCTAPGKYKIGKPYFGKFGLAYKLYGLDKTNSNAFNRFVVLHSHSCVPDIETAPGFICKSWGCPTVSPLFLNSLKTYIEKSQQPILLWIFN
jgi:hypothetical protein